MRMWSKGLWKIEMEVDGRTMEVIKQDKEIKITENLGHSNYGY